MSLRHFTRKLLGLYKTKKMSPERPPSSHLSRSRSRSRSKTPLNALDTNSPLWPRFYNRLVRKQNPNMSDEDVQRQVAVRVDMRGKIRDKNIARQNATRRPPSLQTVGLYMPIQVNKSRSRPNTPLFAKDSNSPHWPRIYEKAIKRGDPSIGEERLKQQVAQQVRLRKELRARKQATKHRGGKKSRRKSRSLLSIFY